MSGKKRGAKPRSGETHRGKPQASTSPQAGKGGGTAESRRVQRILAERRARRNRLLMKIGGAAGVAVLAVVALIVINNARDGNMTRALVIPTPGAVDVVTDGRTKGDPNAPVQIVEWGDYQCPACAVFTREFEPQLVRDYVATGKVFVEYRDMPFLGAESRAAGRAAVCAENQDRFWEFHTMLYFNQGEQKNTGAFSRSRLNDMARTLDLNMDDFGSCMTSDATDAEVQRMYDDARANGIDSTPSFSINGTRVSGANYAAIRQAIDAALAGR
jgi:protein-disulfide isomerase